MQKFPPKQTFPCIDCGTPLRCFPSEAPHRRCSTCLSALRSAIGTKNAAARRPVEGATKQRAYPNVTYRFVYQPRHPNAPKSGWVAEHRLVMEAKLGRLLNREEVVHHADRNGLNNDPENLVLEVNRGEHLGGEHCMDGVAARMAAYPQCACGARAAIGETTCWACWKKSQTCPACGRPNRRMARRDMCHGCYKRLRVSGGRYHQATRPNKEV